MSADIVQIDGLYWPASDRMARPVIQRDCRSDIAALLPHVQGRQVIVQAGANIGTYPLALTDHFACVRTFEPDPTNYACLVKNLEARDSLRRVVAHNAALGAEPGYCTPVVVEQRNCGAHRVDFEKGAIPVTTIDAMALQACDCIFLDIEGAELFALQGGVETIKRFGPTIALEDKGLGARFFDVPPGAVQQFLTELGYEQVGAYGRDKVFRVRC